VSFDASTLTGHCTHPDAAGQTARDEVGELLEKAEGNTW
jgi:hypothetical protein